MRLDRLPLLVGLVMAHLSIGCGSVLTTNDGTGGSGGTVGAGGAGGGQGGAAAGGRPGTGGAGGASCSELANRYSAALRAAQSCDVSAGQQCQQLVSASLSPCSINCMTYVNDSSTLDAIKASWEQAGCNDFVVLCPAIACLQPTNGMCVAGDGGSGTCSSSAGGAGGGGRGGADGRGGAGGQGGGGGGGAAGTACPPAPPVDGAPCAGQDCFYEDCAGAGRTVARCHPEGTFEVVTTACTDVACSLSSAGGSSCPPGMICMQLAGGAVTEECVQNTCGTGPIGCGCLTSCAGACGVSGTSGGIQVSCNTCPPGQLCP
jgi:hypothetical protein